MLKDDFTHCWEDSKLKFYHSVKSVFSIEPYLELCKGLKVSPGVLAQRNLESVHMNFKLKQVDTSISLDSKGFAPGARLI